MSYETCLAFDDLCDKHGYDRACEMVKALLSPREDYPHAAVADLIQKVYNMRLMDASDMKRVAEIADGIRAIAAMRSLS